MAELKIDVDTASREDLVAEVHRLLAQCNQWRDAWHKIVRANTEAFRDELLERDRKIALLESIAEHCHTEELPWPVWPCKICGASITNGGQHTICDNTDGENVPHKVCYLCFRSPLFKPHVWRDRHYFEVSQ